MRQAKKKKMTGAELRRTELLIQSDAVWMNMVVAPGISRVALSRAAALTLLWTT
jgi:hypothetical protein